MERVVLIDDEIDVLKQKGCYIGDETQDIVLEEGEIKEAKQYAERIRSHLPKTDEEYELAYSKVVMKIEKYEGHAPIYLQNYAVFLRVMREINRQVESKEYVNYDQYPIERIDGYDFLIFDKGAIFYKSLTWFFDTTSQNNRMWVGDLRVVYQYLRMYQVGLMVYQAKEKTPAFIMSDANLATMYHENETPENIREILRWMFGIDVDIAQQVEYLKRPLWLNSRTVCDADADVRRYAAGPKGIFRDFQHELFEYIERRFNCVATYLRPTTGPFFYCNPAEVTIQPVAVEQLTQHPLSWTSYGYVDITQYKKYVPRNIYNTKFRVLQWLEESCMVYENKTSRDCPTPKSSVICVDVQQFKSIFEGITIQQMINSLAYYVQRWSPKLLMCVNIPAEYTKQLKNTLGYRHHVSVYNGAWDKSIEMAIYYNDHMKYTIHKYKDRIYSNFITAEFMGYKVAFVAALMAPLYTTDIGYNDAFKEKYTKNREKYARFIRAVLDSAPVVIVGQFPSLDVYSTITQMLEDVDYTAKRSSTNIDHFQSHWIWHKSGMEIEQCIYPWSMAKIRPIGFKFCKDIIVGSSERGGILYALIIVICMIVATIVVAMQHAYKSIIYGHYCDKINIYDRTSCVNYRGH